MQKKKRSVTWEVNSQISVRFSTLSSISELLSIEVANQGSAPRLFYRTVYRRREERFIKTTLYRWSIFHYRYRYNLKSIPLPLIAASESHYRKTAPTIILIPLPLPRKRFSGKTAAVPTPVADDRSPFSSDTPANVSRWEPAVDFIEAPEIIYSYSMCNKICIII